jgi:hypothetical protein
MTFYGILCLSHSCLSQKMLLFKVNSSGGFASCAFPVLVLCPWKCLDRSAKQSQFLDFRKKWVAGLEGLTWNPFVLSSFTDSGVFLQYFTRKEMTCYFGRSKSNKTKLRHLTPTLENAKPYPEDVTHAPLVWIPAAEDASARWSWPWGTSRCQGAMRLLFLAAFKAVKLMGDSCRCGGSPNEIFTWLVSCC